ncbi:hypothetical protein Gogos_021355 [Gossypium gossypioides]|uniref:Uncharacterized protein n=1 Tax=Gossypium gossypioides TaxID=34282 RepID=A0A7J9D371_GOSGO|nr:hypothetical protein [Gossypium gossypioides]
MVKALKEETMVTTMALSTRIEELERELVLCRAAVGKGVSSVALSYEDIMKNYFRAKGITGDAVKVNNASMFLIDIDGGEVGPQIKGNVRLGRDKSFNVS